MVDFCIGTHFSPVSLRKENARFAKRAVLLHTLVIAGQTDGSASKPIKDEVITKIHDNRIVQVARQDPLIALGNIWLTNL